MVPDTSAAATRRENAPISKDTKIIIPEVNSPPPAPLQSATEAVALTGKAGNLSKLEIDSVANSPAASVVAKFDLEAPSPITTPGVMADEKSLQVPFKVTPFFLSLEQAQKAELCLIHACISPRNFSAMRFQKLAEDSPQPQGRPPCVVERAGCPSSGPSLRTWW